MHDLCPRHACDIDVFLFFSSRVLGMKTQNNDNSNRLHTGELMWGRPGVSPRGRDVPTGSTQERIPLPVVVWRI